MEETRIDITIKATFTVDDHKSLYDVADKIDDAIDMLRAYGKVSLETFNAAKDPK